MYRGLLGILFLFLITAGCSKAPYLPYHSTASIDHYTRMVQTDMTLINSEETETQTLSYAVIAAVDNDQVPYILISPAMNNSSDHEKDLWDYNISYSTTIHPDKADELINALEIVLREWNNEQAEEDGYFFEFSHTPEHRIFQESENVVAKLPSIRVNFNVTAEGPTGSLIIGEGDMRYFYEFEEIEKVRDFRNLLEKALSELGEMKS